MQVMAFGSLQLDVLLGRAKPVVHPALPKCWQKPGGSTEAFGDVKAGFAPLAFRFDNNIVMNIIPQNYFVMPVKPLTTLNSGLREIIS
jgi:hypothetical protein